MMFTQQNDFYINVNIQYTNKIMQAMHKKTMTLSVPFILSTLLVPCFLADTFCRRMLKPAVKEKQRTVAYNSTTAFKISKL